jgi:hypothetical protein
MTRHPSTEKLAEYAEGVLRRRTTVRISSHLAVCNQCPGKIEQLRQVTTVLTRTSAKFAAMPDRLVTRVEMAIAAESETRVTSAPATGEASRRDLPARGRRQRRAARRFPIFNSPLAGSLAAVGAAVVIAGGGYEIASNLGSGAATSSSSSVTHPPAARAEPGLSQFSGAAAAAGGQVRYGPAVKFQHAGHQDSIYSVQTGTNFTAAGLIAEARKVLADVRDSNLKDSNQAMTNPYASSAASGVVSAGQLHACVSKVAAGKNVLLVDSAKYEGKAAMIIVVGTPPDGPGVIYAAGLSCSAASADILARQDLPRP